MDVTRRPRAGAPGCGCPESEEETVGSDDRVIVADTKKSPHRWVCSLDLYFEDPDNRKQAFWFPATGTLISEKHVLTCGHALIYDIEGTKGAVKRLKAKRVTVIPGRWGVGRTAADRAPFGSSDMAAFHVPDAWKQSLDPYYDFGLIKLKEPLGKPPLGYWGGGGNGQVARIEAVTAAGLKGQTVYTSGYPGDKCGHLPQTGSAPDSKDYPCPNRGSTQWRTSGKALSVIAKNIYHDLDTHAGQSGSPVWLQDSVTGALRMIAVHTGSEGPGGPNRGVLLTADVLNQVKKWM